MPKEESDSSAFPKGKDRHPLLFGCFFSIRVSLFLFFLFFLLIFYCFFHAPSYFGQLLSNVQLARRQRSV